jgi:glycine/D-amino acid oxidase-like deaminating enzyme
MLDERTTEQLDLRGGRTPWIGGFQRLPRQGLRSDLRCDVLIVGAGITGALVAEHLTREGHDVVIVDRERPGHGSTAASTAMLLWEIDRSLSELSELYGFERAAAIYRRSFETMRGISGLIEHLGLACDFGRRDALYLASPDKGKDALLAEHRLRSRAGLPGRFLDFPELLGEYGFAREAALLSPGAAEADPLRLAQGLLRVALARGARLFDAEAVAYDCASRAVGTTTDSGHCIEARHVVLATGYVMPDFVPSDLHKIVSSFAIATPPQPQASLWRGRALIWEAAKNYLYARTTVDDRIIVGGEDDENAVAPEARDALMPEKAEAILRRFSALQPDIEMTADFIWSGAFGTTADGLPLIGRVPGRPGICAAYGYGGNGITFSYLAAQMIGEIIAGRERPWFDDFAIDRDVPKYVDGL